MAILRVFVVLLTVTCIHQCLAQRYRRQFPFQNFRPNNNFNFDYPSSFDNSVSSNDFAPNRRRQNQRPPQLDRDSDYDEPYIFDGYTTPRPRTRPQARTTPRTRTQVRTTARPQVQPPQQLPEQPSAFRPMSQFPTVAKLLATPCETSCHRFVTPEYNPICGSDKITYTNPGKMDCANKCGKNINVGFYGTCQRPSGTI